MHWALFHFQPASVASTFSSLPPSPILWVSQLRLLVLVHLSPPPLSSSPHLLPNHLALLACHISPEVWMGVRAPVIAQIEREEWI